MEMTHAHPKITKIFGLNTLSILSSYLLCYPLYYMSRPTVLAATPQHRPQSR